MAVGCDKWEELEQDLALALSADSLNVKPRLRCSAPGCNHADWSGNWSELSSRYGASVPPSGATDIQQAHQSYWSKLEQAGLPRPRPQPRHSPVDVAENVGDETASEVLARQLQAESDAEFARHLQAQGRPVQPRRPAPVDEFASLGAEEFARRLQAECDAEFARQLQEQVDAAMRQASGRPPASHRPQSSREQRRSQRIATDFEPLLQPGVHQAERAYWNIGDDEHPRPSDTVQNDHGSSSSRSQTAGESALDSASVAAARLRSQLMDLFSPASQNERLQQWRPNDQQRRPSHSSQLEMTAFERSVQQNLERRRAIRELWGDPNPSGSARSNSPSQPQQHRSSGPSSLRSAAVEAAVRAEALRRREEASVDPDYRGIDWNASAWDDWNEIALRRAREAYELTGRGRTSRSSSPETSPIHSPMSSPRPPPPASNLSGMRASPARRPAADAPARVRGRVATEARAAGFGSQTVVAPFRSPAPGTEADGALVECAICMEKFSDGESLRTLPCLHKYHIPCIDRWLASNRQCPICKHNVF